MGGNAFNVSTVDQSLIPSIFKQFKTFLASDLELDDLLVLDDSVVGLGSTRLALNNIETKKKQSGDIDLLIKIKESALNKHNGMQGILKAISSRFDKHGIAHRVFFGNIFSSAFKNIQVDLILAPPSKNDDAYEYLRDLLYYSDETDPTRAIKGLHRTELVRYLLKNVGLQMSTKGLATYKWVGLSENDAIDFLNKNKRKAKRRKKLYESVLNAIITKGFQSFKDELVNPKTGFVRNTNSIGDFYDQETLGMLTRSPMFEKVDLTDNWRAAIASFLGYEEVIDITNKFKTFESTLDFIKELEILEILDRKAVNSIMENYVVRLKERDHFNTSAKEKILSRGFQI